MESSSSDQDETPTHCLHSNETSTNCKQARELHAHRRCKRSGMSQSERSKGDNLIFSLMLSRLSYRRSLPSDSRTCKTHVYTGCKWSEIVTRTRTQRLGERRGKGGRKRSGIPMMQKELRISAGMPEIVHHLGRHDAAARTGANTSVASFKTKGSVRHDLGVSHSSRSHGVCPCHATTGIEHISELHEEPKLTRAGTHVHHKSEHSNKVATNSGAYCLSFLRRTATSAVEFPTPLPNQRRCCLIR